MFQKDRFVESCQATLGERAPQLAVQELIREAVASPREIERELGLPTAAGFTVIHRSDQLTILNFAWAPEMLLYPHNHNLWAVIGIYGGQEDNTFYRRRPGGVGLEQVNGRSLVDGEVVVLGQDVIHAVSNPRRSYTTALHVYGGDFFAVARSEWESADAAEQPFDLERVKRTFAEATERAQALLSQAQRGT
jgi:predicted metal-dependent enzyme (double-stranded beta helix superfamily)